MNNALVRYLEDIPSDKLELMEAILSPDSMGKVEELYPVELSIIGQNFVDVENLTRVLGALLGAGFDIKHILAFGHFNKTELCETFSLLLLAYLPQEIVGACQYFGIDDGDIYRGLDEAFLEEDPGLLTEAFKNSCQSIEYSPRARSYFSAYITDQPRLLTELRELADSWPELILPYRDHIKQEGQKFLDYIKSDQATTGVAS